MQLIRIKNSYTEKFIIASGFESVNSTVLMHCVTHRLIQNRKNQVNITSWNKSLSENQRVKYNLSFSPSRVLYTINPISLNWKEINQFLGASGFATVTELEKKKVMFSRKYTPSLMIFQANFLLCLD